MINETEKNYISDNLRVFIVPVDILTADLSAHEKLVYIVLRSFVNPHKNEAFPSIDTIANLASISRSTAIRAIKTLEEKCYIIKELRFQYDHKRKTTRQTSNLYKLNLPSATQTRGGCHTDTGGVSHRHGGGVTQTPNHNHLTKSFNKEEEEDINIENHSLHFENVNNDPHPENPKTASKIEFDSHCKSMKLSHSTINAINEKLREADYSIIDDYSPEAIQQTFRKLKNRISSIGNVAQWFVTTLINTELSIQQDYEAQNQLKNTLRKYRIWDQ